MSDNNRVPTKVVLWTAGIGLGLILVAFLTAMIFGDKPDPPAPPSGTAATSGIAVPVKPEIMVWSIEVGKASPYSLQNLKGFDGNGSTLSGEWIHNRERFRFEFARDGSTGHWWTMVKADGNPPDPIQRDAFTVERDHEGNYVGSLQCGPETRTVRLYRRKL